MQVDFRQRILFCLLRILEVYSLKIHRAVSDIEYRVFGVFECALLVKHLTNSLERLCRHGKDDVYHRQHHKGDEYLHTVGKHCGYLSYVDSRSAAGYGKARADSQNEYHIEIQTELHYWGIERHYALRASEITHNVLGCRAELFFFVIFARKSLYNAHSADVFLDSFIEAIVFLENTAESRHRVLCDKQKSANKDGNNNYEGGCKRSTHDVCHDDSEKEHKRRTYSRAYYHHIRHLRVADIRGKTCNEGCRGKFVDILKRIGLDLSEKISAQVLCESRRRFSAGVSRDSAARK